MYAVCLAALLSLAWAQSPSVQLNAIDVEPMEIRPNLLANGGFEQVGAAGFPAGWEWSPRNTDAVCAVDEQVRRSGARSLRIRNGTPFGAHVYGMLWASEPVHLTPGKTYTLSGWFRSADPGIAHLMGGAGWQYRAAVPATAGRWQRAWVTFKAEEADTQFVARLSTESPTQGFWVDDLKLEEGLEPTASVPEDAPHALPVLDAAAGTLELPGDGPFGASFLLSVPAEGNYSLTAELSPDGRRASLMRRLGRGAYRVTVTGTTALPDDVPRRILLRVGMGPQRMSIADTSVAFVSPKRLAARLQAIQAALPSHRAVLERLSREKQPIAYPRVALTVLENFVGYAREDIARDPSRAAMQIREMEALLASLKVQLSRAVQGERLPEVPRRDASRRPRIVNGVFTAASLRPDGSTGPERPFYFHGYGAFGQVRADMEKWPGYGVNIIQVEFGPSSVFPSPEEQTDAPVRETLALLDRARRAGVMVDLLISPHYMPAWVFEKYPEMRRRREGFIGYCTHAPAGRELLQRFLNIVVPPLKDHPALNSICLTNEPVQMEEPCPFAEQAWRAWLARRHGNAETLNARWGTSYASFAEVPLPNPFTDSREGSRWYDYVRFNQEDFAEWHGLLARTIRRIAPNLPVHAKAMTWTMLNDGDVRYGVDPLLFARFSQINGNDAINWYSFGTGEFAQAWTQNAMGHDLQRSVLDAPVFNSENHLILDRDRRSIPPEHIYTALWQAAVHGQGATTIWVWERTHDPKSDFAGSIMHRPLCAEAVGRVNLDMNRAAHEMAALQRAPVEVLLLHSLTAMVQDGGRYTDCLGKLYTALAFLGVKVGFVTERQLEEGAPRGTVPLLIPNVSRLSAKALAGLAAYRGQKVGVGAGRLLAADEYGGRAAGLESSISFTYGRTTAADLLPPLSGLLARLGLQDGPRVTALGGGAAYGVAWRTARTASGPLVNMVNYLHKPITVQMVVGGKPARGRDVLRGVPIGPRVTLRPLEVRLVRLAP